MGGIGALDTAIVAVYMAAMMGLGWWAGRPARRGVDAYFLGSRRLPWWMLAMSGSSSYWDITGTMWIVSLLVVMGMKAMWHQWIWGFPLPVFFAAFMGKWINRSKVRTAAEWMKTRFGEGPAGSAARSAYAALAVVTVTGFLAFDAVGMGKFGALYLPFPPGVCAVLILGLTGAYIIFGGFHSLVITEAVQTVVMSLGALVICWLGFARTDFGALAARVGEGWFDLGFGWTEPGLGETEFFLFGALVIAWVSKGLLLSFGGPEQLYDFQRFLSARDDRAAAKAGALWGALHTLRWPMAMAIALLFLGGLEGVGDTEQVLPAVIRTALPAGLRGLVLAALLAAFMSTFNSTVNAGASYLVVDVYKKYIDPGADERRLVRASRVSSLLLIVAGLAIGSAAGSIHRMFQWIMAALGAGVLLPNLLRWYWWRLNGWGFTAGVLTGIGASIVQALAFPAAPLYVYFPAITGLGLLASVAATYATPPTDAAVLMEFYRTVQPAGLWGPVRRLVRDADPSFRKEPFGPSLLNVALGIPWIFCLWTAPMFAVGRRFEAAAACGVAALGLTTALYFTWYRPLAANKAEIPAAVPPDAEPRPALDSGSGIPNS